MKARILIQENVPAPRPGEKIRLTEDGDHFETYLVTDVKQPRGGMSSVTLTLPPSRRFRCANCDEKCRSTARDRGKRKFCRGCESLIEKCYPPAGH